MNRKRFFVMVLLINIFISFNTGFTQTTDTEKKYNKQYNTLALVKRLSYENYKNIRLLRTAIINYGGGEAEFQKLIDQYAEATALYFEDKIEESASKFTENERDILKTAKKIADVYSKDSSQFFSKAIKRNIQIGIQVEAISKDRKPAMDKAYNNAGVSIEKFSDYAKGSMDKSLENAKAAIKKASSIRDDYKYLSENSSGSAQRLITSIYYYRAAKDNLFLIYQTFIDVLILDEKDSKKDKELKNQLLDKMIKEDYKEEYKKDMQDNKNKVYDSMEKKV
jgi:hypothetical protein